MEFLMLNFLLHLESRSVFYLSNMKLKISIFYLIKLVEKFENSTFQYYTWKLYFLPR